MPLQVCIVAKTIISKKNPKIVKEELLNSLWESDAAEEQEFNIQSTIDQTEAIYIIRRFEEL